MIRKMMVFDVNKIIFSLPQIPQIFTKKVIQLSVTL